MFSCFFAPEANGGALSEVEVYPGPHLYVNLAPPSNRGP